MVQIIFSYAFILIVALLFAVTPTLAEAAIALVGNAVELFA
ncbi:MAG: hypothetical protein AAGA69_10725 [Pseudomonadota bacterium]